MPTQQKERRKGLTKFSLVLFCFAAGGGVSFSRSRSPSCSSPSSSLSSSSLSRALPAHTGQHLPGSRTLWPAQLRGGHSCVSQTTLAWEQRHRVQASGNHSSSSSNSSPSKRHEPAPGIGKIARRGESVTFMTASESKPQKAERKMMRDTGVSVLLFSVRLLQIHICS